jgi:serine protease Do
MASFVLRGSDFGTFIRLHNRIKDVMKKALAIYFILPGWRVLVMAIVTAALVYNTTQCCGVADERLDLQRLREIQNSIQGVVFKNMGSCVAVSDGVGFGSGVIVSADGLVLTAGHVITGPGPFEVILPTGRTVKAKSLGKNLNADIGMVQITEPGPWPHVEIAELQPAKIRDPLLGNWVVSLGHSGGFELGRVPPVRTGRILSRRHHQIVTDAVLIGGDSGGPLFDLDGKLIAIHSSIGDSIAENRHVTVDIFRRDWDRLLKGESWGKLPELNEPGEKRREGKIGVIVDRTADRAVVKSVNDESPAGETGIRAGDIIVSFNRIKIKNGDHLIETIKKYNAGQVFPIEIERNGKTIKFEIQLR